MNNPLKRQQGLTFISLVFVLAIVGFFVLLTLKIAPIYLDHSKVVNALKGLEATPDLISKSPDEIKLILSKRFSMNYVNAITYNDIKITKRSGYLKVQIAYEVVEKIMGNASVLVEFDNAIEVGEDS
jgi:competence protein ComGC